MEIASRMRASSSVAIRPRPGPCRRAVAGLRGHRGAGKKGARLCRVAGDLAWNLDLGDAAQPSRLQYLGFSWGVPAQWPKSYGFLKSALEQGPKSEVQGGVAEP